MTASASLQDLHPLSHNQEELVDFICRYTDCSPNYDQWKLLRLGGVVDPECLLAAVEDVSDRHDVLRTTIATHHGERLQRVHAEAQAPALIDASVSDVDQVRRELITARRHDDVLDGEPLFRVRLDSLDDGWLLALNVHHLAFDEWSEAVLWRDIAEFYAARRDRRPAELPQLHTTYGKFSRMQRAAWPVVSRAALPYWGSALRGYTGAINWPKAAPTTSSRNETDVLRLDLDQAAVAPSLASARAMNATPFMALMAATSVAATRVTGQQDLVLGTDWANREEQFKHDMIGFFVNTRMTRVRLHSVRSFAELLRSLRQSWLAADDHRDAHFHEILKVLGEPDLMRVDMLKTATLPPLKLPGVSVNKVPLRLHYNYWRPLGVTWFPRPRGGYSAEIRYRPSVVDRAAVTTMAAELEGVLRAPDAAF